jgi:hypothetical protein
MVIPASAFISNFSMTIKGVEYVAEIKEKKRSKKRHLMKLCLQDWGLVLSNTNIFTVETNIEPGQKVIFKLVH